jgi:hypothetical protein
VPRQRDGNVNIEEKGVFVNVTSCSWTVRSRDAFAQIYSGFKRGRWHSISRGRPKHGSVRRLRRRVPLGPE